MVWVVQRIYGYLQFDKDILIFSGANIKQVLCVKVNLFKSKIIGVRIQENFLRL